MKTERVPEFHSIWDFEHNCRLVWYWIHRGFRNIKTKCTKEFFFSLLTKKTAKQVGKGILLALTVVGLGALAFLAFFTL